MTGTERVQSFNRMQGTGSTNKAGSKESASAGVEGIFERLLQERQNAVDETENKKDTVQSEGKQDTKEAGDSKAAQTEKTESQQTGDKKAESVSETQETGAEEVLTAQMLGAAYLLNETELLELPEEVAAVEDDGAAGVYGVEGVFVSQAEEKPAENMPMQSVEGNVQTVSVHEQIDMPAAKAETVSGRAEANVVKEAGNRPHEEGMFQAETAVQASGNDIRQEAQAETAAVKDISVPVKTTENGRGSGGIWSSWEMGRWVFPSMLTTRRRAPTATGSAPLTWQTRPGARSTPCPRTPGPSTPAAGTTSSTTRTTTPSTAARPDPRTGRSSSPGSTPTSTATTSAFSSSPPTAGWWWSPGNGCARRTGPTA